MHMNKYAYIDYICIYRVCVLFFGTQFSNLYTAVDTPYTHMLVCVCVCVCVCDIERGREGERERERERKRKKEREISLMLCVKE